MSQRIDLTGQQFGRLMVIEMLYGYKKKQTYCCCKCECGNTKIVLATNLRRGATKSCGCLERASRYGRNHTIDLLGQRFGLLTVIAKCDRHATNGTVYWQCQCGCGQYREVSSNSLRRGAVVSCGCQNFSSLKLNLTGQRFGMLVALDATYIDKYVSNRTAWTCQCDCGNRVVVSTMSLVKRNTMSCGCTMRSHREILIDQWLTSMGVAHYYNYRDSDCINPITGRCLPFDFYIPAANCLIEYDGAQHYIAKDWFGGSEGLAYRQQLDKLKDDYCLSHGIQLFRIPYTLTDDEIKQMLINIVNPVTTTVA